MKMLDHAVIWNWHVPVTDIDQINVTVEWIVTEQVNINN
jgi:hypothetical protein